MKTLPTCGLLIASLALFLPPAPADDPVDATATALLAAHNKEREAEKVPPLSLDEALTKAARLHAEDMAEHHEMTHEGSDGSKPFERVKRQGYHFTTTGENVARGQASVAGVMKAWMESEGHRKNVLGDFAQMGAAKVADDEDETYWCVVFATPRPRLDPDGAEAEVLEKVAEARKEAGKGPVKLSPKLAKAARALAAEMAESFAKPEGERKPPDVAGKLKEVGASYRSVAVVVGGGDPTAADFMKAILGDEARKEPLLGDFDSVGIGYARDAEDAAVWCVLLVEE